MVPSFPCQRTTLWQVLIRFPERLALHVLLLPYMDIYRTACDPFGFLVQASIAHTIEFSCPAASNATPPYLPVILDSLQTKSLGEQLRRFVKWAANHA